MSNFSFTKIIFLSVVIFFASTLVFAQTPTATPLNDEGDVVKISTSLVQVDAVVTDKNGTPVTNLTANDFEILQDGKPQKIADLSYVKRTVNTKAANQNQAAVNKTVKNSQPPPIASEHSPEFGRILTFVVDDGSV